MYVMVTGLNYRTAPVEVREKFAFSEDNLKQALERLKQTKSVLEAVIISTCNRTEIYTVVDQLHTGEHFVKRYLSEWFEMDKGDLIPFLYVYKDIDATEHLFKVITGLDSMVIGETQILGQVKEAFLRAQTEGVTGTIFNTLFKQAITFAKKVHANTGIGENAVSVSYAAVELAKRIFDSLEDKRVLIIGAGEMSELTAIHLHAQGVKKVMVVNRTYETAKKLADTFHGKAYTMEKLKEVLIKADIVISSTGSEAIIIDKDLIKGVKKERDNRPLFMIDIAVPRDIGQNVSEIDHVFLYDIDDLQGIVDANIEERKRVANQIIDWVDDEIYSFYQWVNTLGVIPLIEALREKSFRIQEETMKSIQNKIPHLSEKELKVIRKHTKSIVNQMLKNPIVRLKEMSDDKDADIMIDYFKKIFALEDDDINSNPVYELLTKKSNMDSRVVSRERLSKMSSR